MRLDVLCSAAELDLGVAARAIWLEMYIDLFCFPFSEQVWPATSLWPHSKK